MSNRRVSNNQQRRQQHLLEVTIRRDKAIAQRNRAILVVTCKLLLVVAAVAAAYLGSREALRRFVWENEDYYLTDIRVSTDGALTREQILTAGNIVEGRNIFTINIAAARDAIDNLPQVERAEIQRVLPNRINIQIIERRPIAWVTARADEDPSTSEKSFLIDARGVVMRSKTVLPEYLHLPVISGVEVGNLAPGQRVQSFEMQAALDLVRLNVDSTRFQVRNIDVSKGYCLVVTDRSKARITFGLDRVDKQLERLNRLLDHLEQGKREIQTVNLLVERNVPVTFAPPPSPEPEPVAAAAPAATPAKSESVREKFLATQGKSAASKSSATPSRSTPAATKYAAMTKPKKSAVPDPIKVRSTPAPTPRATTPAPQPTPFDSFRKPFRLNG